MFAYKRVQLTDECHNEPERYHKIPNVRSSRVDVKLETEGRSQDDEDLQEVVPRSERLEPRENLFRTGLNWFHLCIKPTLSTLYFFYKNWCIFV